ncbi:MAG: hypothetical protein ACI3T9_00575 [Romboutsia timonensis]
MNGLTQRELNNELISFIMRCDTSLVVIDGDYITKYNQVELLEWLSRMKFHIVEMLGDGFVLKDVNTDFIYILEYL